MNDAILFPAYHWECQECGCDNFEKGYIPELDDDQLQELKEEMGMEDSTADYIVGMPEEVTCQFCDKTYQAMFFEES